MSARSCYQYPTWQELTKAMEAHDENRIMELILSLGISALEENGDWGLLHRARPLEMPYA